MLKVARRFGLPNYYTLVILSATICLPLASLLLTYHNSIIWKATATAQTRSFSTQFHPRVTIWYPHICRGNFISEKAFLSPEHPYIVIREAVIDRRPLSYQQFKQLYPTKSFIRIVLLASVHLSVALTAAHATAVLRTTKRVNVSDISAKVDFVQRSDSFLFTGPYKLGRKTKHGTELSTHHIAISLTPTTHLEQSVFNQRIFELTSAGATLDISIPFERFDGFLLEYTTSFMLSCATGWEQPNTFPTLPSLQSSVCTSNVHAASGAVLLAASTPTRAARGDPAQYYRMAHFAARALTGAMPFDAVVIPILVNNSVEDRNSCEDSQCVSRLKNQNAIDMERIRNSIEEEFKMLDLDRGKWGQLILLPFCRLGTDSAGKEYRNPCGLDYQSGRYHMLFFTYLMIAPYFKWAASLDLDGFFAPSSNSIYLPAKKIEHVFDRSSIFAGGSVCYQYANFRVKGDYSRQMTMGFMRGTAPKLRGNASEDCFRNRDSSGKCAVRCDVGLGFTIHNAVVRKHPANRSLDMTQRMSRSRQLRAWRPLMSGKNARCEYVS